MTPVPRRNDPVANQKRPQNYCSGGIFFFHRRNKGSCRTRHLGLKCDKTRWLQRRPSAARFCADDANVRQSGRRDCLRWRGAPGQSLQRRSLDIASIHPAVRHAEATGRLGMHSCTQRTRVFPLCPRAVISLSRNACKRGDCDCLATCSLKTATEHPFPITSS